LLDDEEQREEPVRSRKGMGLSFFVGEKNNLEDLVALKSLEDLKNKK